MNDFEKALASETINKEILAVTRQTLQYLREESPEKHKFFIQHADRVVILAQAQEIARQQNLWGLQMTQEGWRISVKQDGLWGGTLPQVKETGIRIDEDGYLLNKQNKRISIISE